MSGTPPRQPFRLIDTLPAIDLYGAADLNAVIRPEAAPPPDDDADEPLLVPAG